MGLDMYLYRKVWIAQFDDKNVLAITINGEPVEGVNPKNVKYVEEEVGYWRKANHIHKWFVDNVQNGNDDCGDYFVPKAKMQELLEACQEAKKMSVISPENVPGILPTQNGFFFGSTEYDEYYWEDISRTIKILEKCLKDNLGEFYYHSSW